MLSFLFAALLMATVLLPWEIASAEEGLDLEREITLDYAGKHREAVSKLPPDEQREFLIRSQKWIVTDYHRASQHESRIESALDDETRFEFIETQLTDVLEFVSELHDIQVVLDRNSLDAIGVKPETPITADLKSISCGSALRLILNPLQLDYLIENQTLKITTLAVSSSTMQTRVYETRRFTHLEDETIAEAIRAGVNPDSWRNQANAGRGGDFGSGFEGEFGAETDGGNGGQATLTMIPGGLVIRQSQRCHEQIADLLTQLDNHHSNPLYEHHKP